MKMIERIHSKLFLTVVVAVFALTSCGRSKDIKVVSCDIASLTPSGLKSVNAVLAVELDNPSAAFDVRDITARVNKEGLPFAEIEAEPISVEGKTKKVYELPCKCTLVNDLSLFEVMSLLAVNDFSVFTVDVSAVFSNKLGLHKKIEKKGISFDEIESALNEKNSEK